MVTYVDGLKESAPHFIDLPTVKCSGNRTWFGLLRSILMQFTTMLIRFVLKFVAWRI